MTEPLHYHTYSITAYNADMESLSIRPEHLDNYAALCNDAWDIGPMNAAPALAYVSETGRVGVRTDDNSALIVEPVAFYRVWHNYAPGHFELYPAPKTSAHSTCTHPSTSAARAACRRANKEN